MKLKKKYSVSQLPAHYTGIDYLPILNWEMVHKKNDFSYLLVSPQKLNEDQQKKLAEVWVKIYDEYIEVFGFGEHFKDILKAKIEIAKLKLRKILEQKESLQNFINVQELKLTAMETKNVESDIYKTKALIEKKLGIRIPLKDTSVREFYSYLKDIK